MKKMKATLLLTALLLQVCLGADVYFASNIFKLFNFFDPGACTFDSPCNNGLGPSNTIVLPNDTTVILLNYSASLLSPFRVDEPFGSLRVDMSSNALPTDAHFSAFDLVISHANHILPTVSLNLNCTHLTLDSWTTLSSGVINFSSWAPIETWTISNSQLRVIPTFVTPTSLTSIHLSSTTVTEQSTLPVASSSITFSDSTMWDIGTINTSHLYFSQSTFRSSVGAEISCSTFQSFNSTFSSSNALTPIHFETPLTSFEATRTVFSTSFSTDDQPGIQAQRIDIKRSMFEDNTSVGLIGADLILEDNIFNNTAGTGEVMLNITASNVYLNGNLWLSDTANNPSVALSSLEPEPNLTLSGTSSIPHLQLETASWFILDGNLVITEKLEFVSPGRVELVDQLELSPSVQVVAHGSNLTVAPQGTLHIVLSSATTPLSASWSTTILGEVDIDIPASIEVLNASVWKVANGQFFSSPPPALTKLLQLGYDGFFWLGLDNFWYFNVTATFCPPLSCNTDQGICAGRGTCSCIQGFSGPACDCSDIGIPQLAICHPLGGLRWFMNTTLNIEGDQKLVIPPGYNLEVDGDIVLHGLLELSDQASVSVSGAIYHEGTLSMSASAAVLLAGSRREDDCVFNLSSIINTKEFVSNQSSIFKADIDASSLPIDKMCKSKNPLVESESSSLDGHYQIYIIGRKEMRMEADVQRSSNKSASTKAGSLLVETESEGCSSSSTRPGLVSVFTQPCDKSKEPSKWYYWGAPVIAVVGVVFIAAVVILAHPTLRAKVLPYRGTKF